MLDALEARGHAVSLVDKFGSVVVGIGQYCHITFSLSFIIDGRLICLDPFSERSNDGELQANVDFRKAGAVAGY